MSAESLPESNPPAHKLKEDRSPAAILKLILSKFHISYIFLVLGGFAILLGYVSIAPPTDLPNWPLYKLNSRTWQMFEQWGQHVKPHHMRIITTTLQHIESRAMYILTYLNVPDYLHEAGEPLSCEDIKSKIDSRRGLDRVNLAFLCRILHASSHFGLLSSNSEDKYSLTPISEYLVSSHPKSLKHYVMLYSGDEALVISTSLSRSIFSGESGFKVTYRTELQDHLKEDQYFRDVYDAGLGDGSKLHALAIIADYPLFASCRHICDIGGGVGRFLYEVLQYYLHGMNGTNFDLPDVIFNSK